MNSCAHWLLWKEYIEFQKAGLEGIQARPANDNFLEWEVQLEGLKNTLWEGAVLELTLLFSDAYNSVPPTVTFVTIPFHPNVDLDSGRLCLSWLDNRQDWQAGFSISSILLSIQVLLSNPVLEGAVNLTAANMLWSSPSSYHKVLLECVQASQELDRIRKDEHPNSQNKRPVKIIHFEEYLEAWTKMATSTTGSWLRNKAPEDLIKSAETKCPEREAFKALMYGTLHEPKKTERVSEWRQARVDQLRRIYMLHRSPDLLTLRTPVQRDCLGPRNDSQIGGKQDGWENEVDKLVAWTHSLSFQALEGE